MYAEIEFPTSPRMARTHWKTPSHQKETREM